MRATAFHEPKESEIQHMREITGHISQSRSVISTLFKYFIYANMRSWSGKKKSTSEI